MQTTVVGNYPKIGPKTKAPSLRSAISKRQLGDLTEEDLLRVQDEVTAEVLEEQARAGVDLVTDGHIRRDDPQTYFASKIGGFEINGLIRYFDSNTYYWQPIIAGPLAWNGPISVDHYRFAAEHSENPVKAAVIGPYTLASLSQRPHADRLRQAVMELASVLNREAIALSEAGAPVVQFDEPSILKSKGDFALFEEAMAILVDGVSAKTALYTYFGDISGVAKEFLALPFDIIGLDFTTSETNFGLLDGFPKDKDLGLGIIDARNTKMESIENIVDSIKRVSGNVSLDRIQVNPSAGLEFLPRPNAYDKLVRMVEGVQRATEVLS